MTWQDIIRSAAVRRFHRTGLCDPFRLVRADLVRLMCEIEPAFNPSELTNQDIFRVQVRVYVPELNMQIMVDEWEKAA